MIFASSRAPWTMKQGLDVWEVIRLANRHPRVNILTPGPGVGGHCIAVDPWFIVHGAREEAKIIRQARDTNDAKMHHVLARAKALADAHPDAKIACLGLAFKANIDDFRESPARFVAAALAREYGSGVQVVEPYAGDLPVEFEGTGAELVDIDTALEESGVLITLVDHDVFKVIPPEERTGNKVYDTRGIWPDVA
jgi:UDP-N-acetyl-D-mannosaminuronic acid dehydrogenase